MGSLADYIQARPKLRYWASARWPWATLLNRLDSQCWADLVPWALGWKKGEVENFRERIGLVGGGDRCRAESLTHRDGCCYCGKFVAGRRYVGGDQ